MQSLSSVPVRRSTRARENFLARTHVPKCGSCLRAAWLFETVQRFQAAAGDFLTYSGAVETFLEELTARLSPPSSPIESLILRGLFAQASRNLSAAQPLPRTHSPTAVEQVAALLRSQYDRHWTLDAISRSVGRHKTQLTVEFKRSYARSIHQFLTDVRIEAARKLLVETDWKTEAVALAVGYSSRRTFHRQFRRSNGDTPAEFRRRRCGVETAQGFTELTQR